MKRRRVSSVFVVVLAVLFALGFLGQLDMVPSVFATPVTIGTTDTSSTITMPGHHKIFYATSGYFFAFYYNGSTVKYCSSFDGSVWSVQGVLGTTFLNRDAYNDVFYDGNVTVHFCRTSTGANLFYRRGIIGAGNITWDPEQTVYNSTSGYDNGDHSICADSNGYPYIGWASAYGYSYVTKSSLNNGTWLTAADFPYALVPSGSWGCLVTPLNSGKIYVVYAKTAAASSPDYIHGRIYNGSTWGSEIHVSSSLMNYNCDGVWSITSYEDTVDLAFLQNQTYNLQYLFYNGTSDSWSSEETIYSSARYNLIPSLTRVNSTDLYCFYVGHPTDNHVYYIHQKSGVWDTAVDWFVETETLSSNNNRMMTSRHAIGGYIPIFYLSKTTSPRNVRFEKLVVSTTADTTIPTYSNVETNTTTAIQPCMFSCKWQDNVALSGHIFSTNVTTSWVNETWASLGSNPAWANVTKSLPALGSVQYLWYCNDSSNNWATTSTFTLYIGMSPWYTTATHNTTVQSKPVLFYSQWQDLTGLSGHIFGCNITGSFTNETWTAFSGNPAWANVSKTLPATVGTVIQYQWYANNSANTWNNTDLLSLTITASSPPTIVYFSYNATLSNSVCLFASNWTDDYSLSGYIFSWHNGTVWQNNTWTALSGTNAWANVSKTLPTQLVLVQYLWYCNDSDNQFTTTATYTFDMTGYYFSLNFTDLDGNSALSQISWQLYNASTPLTYTMDTANLEYGDYILYVSFRTHQINASTLSAATSGNQILPYPVQIKSLGSSRYAAFDKPVTWYSVLALSDSITSFNVTSASSGITFYVDVPRNCSHVMKNGVNLTEPWWWYTTSPSNHITVYTSTLSNWTLVHVMPAGTVDFGEILPFLQFLWAGDILGFFQAIYVNAFSSADIFFAFLAMLIVIPLYIRLRSLIFLSIAWILIGTLFIVAMPLVSGMAILFLALGLGSMLWQLFMHIRSQT